MPNFVNFRIFKVRDINSVSYPYDPSADIDRWEIKVLRKFCSAFTQLEVGRSMLGHERHIEFFGVNGVQRPPGMSNIVYIPHDILYMI